MNEHGVFDLFTEGSLIFAVIRNSWSEGKANAYSTALKKLVEKTQPGDWGLLVFLDDWELGVPEIEPIIAELSYWCIEHGVTHTAQVYSKSMIKKYQLSKMISENIGEMQLSQFSQIDDAVQWLTAEGFVVSDRALDKISRN
jgi:hypothetical protein